MMFRTILLSSLLILNLQLSAQDWQVINGIRIPTRITGSYDGAISMGIPSNSYNAIRSDGGHAIHFFHENWQSGLSNNSAGSINIHGTKAVTIGNWNNTTAYFRRSDGFVGIGNTAPTHKLTVSGVTATEGIYIPTRYAFDNAGNEQGLLLGVNSGSWNAIKAVEGTQNAGVIHFFDDTWKSGDPGQSAGSINLNPQTAVTIGAWEDPSAYFRKSDGFVGIGNTAPTHQLTVTGVTETDGLYVPGHNEFGPSQSVQGILLGVNDGAYNAIHALNGVQTSGIIHFFDDTWQAGDLHKSAGAINLNPQTAVTIGEWEDPFIYFRKTDGHVGIGTTNPEVKLTVDGPIKSEEITIEVINAPDYVFEETYDLRTLEETKAYVQANKHLPEIPSAKEMEADGVKLGEMNMRLLKKIEELTLHQIALLEQLQKEQARIQLLEEKVQELEDH